MDSKEYVKLCLVTESKNLPLKGAYSPDINRLLHGAIGICTEYRRTSEY